MENYFVFDLDRTLIPNQVYYSKARVRLFEYIYERLHEKAPMDPGDINDIFHEEDSALYRQWKQSDSKYSLSRERLPTAFQNVYKRVLKEAGEEPTAEELDEAYKIGKSIVETKEGYRKRGFIPAADKVLDFLEYNRDELMLLTAGPEEDQRKKIEGLGLEKWFGDDILIVKDKRPEHIHKLLDYRNPEDAWMVGNSLNSDVRTGFRAGTGVVYIPKENQLGKRNSMEIPEHPRLYVQSDITDILKIYDKLDSSGENSCLEKVG